MPPLSCTEISPVAWFTSTCTVFRCLPSGVREWSAEFVMISSNNFRNPGVYVISRFSILRSAFGRNSTAVCALTDPT